MSPILREFEKPHIRVRTDAGLPKGRSNESAILAEASPKEFRYAGGTKSPLRRALSPRRGRTQQVQVQNSTVSMPYIYSRSVEVSVEERNTGL